MSIIVKNTTIINPLDLIAPHACRGCGQLGKAFCDRCKNNMLMTRKANSPKTKGKNLPPVYYIDQLKGPLADLIHEYKYNSVRAIGDIFANLLDEILPQIPGKVSIIPLPTISKHIRERGLDHTLKISKKLAKIRHYKVEQILIRNKNTVQVGSDRSTRLKQAKEAYSIKETKTIDKDTTYILFDDVWTTGASMKAALKKLRFAGASKIIIVFLALS